MPPEEISTRDIVVNLVKALGRIEKAVGENDTGEVLRQLLGKLEKITAVAKGDPGDPGYSPEKGKDYDDGKDGVSIVNASINELGELVLWYSDKREVNLGVVVGRDGDDSAYDEDELLEKLLARVVLPTIDEKALARAAAALVKVPVPETKPVSFKDLKDVPDLSKIVDRAVARQIDEREQQRGVYTGPAHPAKITILNEGVVVAEEVQSIDFRGAAVSVVDLGNGNLVATFTGGTGANVATELVTATQDGDDVNIDLSQLAHTPTAVQWVSRNGQILIPGAMDPNGVSTWEEVAGDIVVYWADAGDSFQISYTY